MEAKETKSFNKNDGYIQRWRVLAMLNNIRLHQNDPDLSQIIDSYIKFSKEVDRDLDKTFITMPRYLGYKQSINTLNYPRC